jgi:hypothetical protein
MLHVCGHVSSPGRHTYLTDYIYISVRRLQLLCPMLISQKLHATLTVPTPVLVEKCAGYVLVPS